MQHPYSYEEEGTFMAKPTKETKGTGMHPTTKNENTNKPFKRNVWLLCRHFRLSKGKNEFNCDYFPHNCYNVAYCSAYEEETSPENRAVREERYNKYKERKKRYGIKRNKTVKNKPIIIQPPIAAPKVKPNQKTQTPKLQMNAFKSNAGYKIIPPCTKEKVLENKKLLTSLVENPLHGDGKIAFVYDSGSFFVLFRDGYKQNFAYNAFEDGYLKLK